MSFRVGIKRALFMKTSRTVRSILLQKEVLDENNLYKEYKKDN